MDGIEAALAECRLYNKPNFTDIANTYGVNRTTLLKRYRGITGSREDGYNS
ncbi:hypothetical protein K432DRAFT_298435 [Lepidopterella palustris CBS 459.81]|uniref:HTH psq-type domain-containing protein n=1 Tax=Lepidopterella palustris CBS 459.81 TaxID=1314670 RepID=A0A8E2EA50_9PEZI|nr:hypothetical protein K432DRAFT_298435 [Lepidopterella palustris CBS 459.81]